MARAARSTGTTVVDPVELVPGRLYALGDSVELDGRVGWVPRDARGWQPHNSYLMLEGNKAMLIDSGPAILESTILAQLERLLDPDSELSLFLSRSELDSIGNAVAICDRLRVQTVYTGGIINPFDAMDQIALASGGRPQMGNLNSPERTRRVIELGNGRGLTVVPAPVRMLAAFWSYDTGTKTLFTADMFGQHVWGEPGYRPAVEDDEDPTTLESFTRSTEARYWWLRGSHTRLLAENMARVFSDHDVERIAPIHGCCVTGAAAVARYRDLMLQMLAELDGERKVA